MQSTLRALLLTGVAAVAALVAFATPQEQRPTGTKVPIMLTPDDVEWKDGPASLPAGAKAFLMEGDPTKPGLFAMRLKFPADYKIQPHFHDDDEHLTVLSGSLNVALGDSFDPSKAKGLPPMSFGVVPAKTHHFAFTKEET